MYKLIEKKKNNCKLTSEEIRYIIDGYTKGDIPDYQMSAFLMAVCFNGMDEDEIYDLTIAMKESGEELDFSSINGIVVDKHSTGGVGDKVSLVAGPMVAACGVPVAKMSGRGLGHTGGTIDKLESFKGFNVNPSLEEFFKNVNEIGIAWAGQTANLAPADKKIYALRDVTATIDSMPLIASSIMSKKLASGAQGIVLDVTYGKGAFMETKEDAKELAQIMIDIGKRQGKKMSAVITSMEEPLGYAIGNIIEVKEAIDVLKGEGPKDVLEVSVAVASHMLVLNGKCKDLKEAKKMLYGVIEDGSALEKMAQWIEKQGGNREDVFDTKRLEKAKYCEKIYLKDLFIGEYEACSEEAVYYISAVDGKKIGMAAVTLGGGRSKKDEEIDLTVGIYLEKKTGAVVCYDDVVAKIFGNDIEKMKLAKEQVISAYSFGSEVAYREVEVYEHII